MLIMFPVTIAKAESGPAYGIQGHPSKGHLVVKSLNVLGTTQILRMSTSGAPNRRA